MSGKIEMLIDNLRDKIKTLKKLVSYAYDEGWSDGNSLCVLNLDDGWKESETRKKLEAIDDY